MCNTKPVLRVRQFWWRKQNTKINSNPLQCHNLSVNSPTQQAQLPLVGVHRAHPLIHHRHITMKAIEATPQSIEVVLKGYRFVIPNFQRPYAWTVDHCDDLLDDISSFCDNAKPKDQYFLGSIVVYPGSNNAVMNVIDGQQRLTTLMILIKVLFEIDSTNTRLEEYLHPPHPSKRDEILYDKLRLSSEVLAGQGRDDYNDFKCVIDGADEYTSNSSPFLVNYRHLKTKVDEWRSNKTPKKWSKLVDTFQKQVVLLQLRCDSADDALDLFQVINDRGLPLDDADIFKAKIYSAIKTKKERDSFIGRWGALENHSKIFKIFSHISRADRNDTSNEVQLRKYISDKHLQSSNALAKGWENLMRSLEICHWLGQVENVCSNEDDQSYETIYWKILKCCPNDYWQYPVYVFVHKYAKGDKGGFSLPARKQREYLVLLRNTARYFFIKSVVYSTLNAVKRTTYRVCAAIAAERDYFDVYRGNIKIRDDVSVLSHKLRDSDYGKNLDGLVFINSIPSNQKSRKRYAAALAQGCDVEHILPNQWSEYPRWNNETHERDKNKIGNLIPLESSINRVIKKAFFKRKQEGYEKSLVADAVDLSKKSPASWSPADVKDRQEKSHKKLMRFFREGGVHD